MSIDPSGRTAPTRRTVLGGAGAVAAVTALAACGSATDETTDPTPAQPPVPTTTSPPGPDAQVVAAVADVPVGGGVLIAGKRLVLTQPTEGDFHAFIAVCTHQGCNIARVERDRILCPCHGSQFGLDGSPVAGPAKRPLRSRAVEARGPDLVVG